MPTATMSESCYICILHLNVVFSEEQRLPIDLRIFLKNPVMLCSERLASLMADDMLDKQSEINLQHV